MDIIGLITRFGVIAILAVIFAESGLLIGFLFPGDSLLFTSGVLIQTGILDINIHLFAILVFIAAVLGDNTGYAFGRRIGSRLFSRQDSKFFKQEYLVRANKFYEKHGAFTIVLARFMPIIRTFTPIVAGASKMNYKKFMMFNLIGGLAWAAGNSYLGYFLGVVFEKVGLHVEGVIYPIIIVIILGSLIPPAWHLLKNKNSRDILFAEIKKQYRQLVAKFKK
jgi:membrane-associated protein